MEDLVAIWVVYLPRPTGRVYVRSYGVHGMSLTQNPRHALAFGTTKAALLFAAAIEIAESERANYCPIK